MGQIYVKDLTFPNIGHKIWGIRMMDVSRENRNIKFFPNFGNFLC